MSQLLQGAANPGVDVEAEKVPNAQQGVRPHPLNVSPFPLLLKRGKFRPSDVLRDRSGTTKGPEACQGENNDEDDKDRVAAA